MVILQAMTQKLEAEVSWGRSPRGGARFTVKLPLDLGSMSDEGLAQQLV